MSCYHPLTALWTGCYTEKNKKDYVILKGSPDKFSLDMFKRLYKGHEYNSCALKFDDTGNDGMIFKELVPVPCGNCIGCRLDYSRSWAVRCILESQYHDDNWFLTLTYDDEHLPCDYSVHKRDLQLFMKRLRKYMSIHFNIDNIRFYACGEYGEKSQRPHYHLILFNLPLNDTKFLSCHLGNKIFVSDIISKCWTLGYHTLGEVNFETAAYTARYVMKKRKGSTSTYYAEHHIEPEFVLMSRRPGIGQQYFDDHKDQIYKTDEVIYKNSKGTASSIKPPAYYDKRFDIENSTILEAVKGLRTTRAVLHRNNVLKNNNFIDDRDYLEHEEELKFTQCKLLHRSL